MSQVDMDYIRNTDFGATLGPNPMGLEISILIMKIGTSAHMMMM